MKRVSLPPPNLNSVCRDLEGRKDGLHDGGDRRVEFHLGLRGELNWRTSKGGLDRLRGLSLLPWQGEPKTGSSWEYQRLWSATSSGVDRCSPEGEIGDISM